MTILALKLGGGMLRGITIQIILLALTLAVLLGTGGVGHISGGRESGVRTMRSAARAATTDLVDLFRKITVGYNPHDSDAISSIARSMAAIDHEKYRLSYAARLAAATAIMDDAERFDIWPPNEREWLRVGDYFVNVASMLGHEEEDCPVVVTDRLWAGPTPCRFARYADGQFVLVEDAVLEERCK